ncbi:iron-containing alcohol dehydrogenase [Ramlibacter sp. WS9]|uniref:iron-containing alcohol dehydrogenase n=1 Tax=Ramlibacter sp. WS9 TaxID=1882741 RepID=UPI001141C733|nr:iron-containing alcohol dehydrogenase [Ramlibacter sp. WS9]ROZ68736.1 maleylacetate reductase [Ramlibacter sp. WS9]
MRSATINGSAIQRVRVGVAAAEAVASEAQLLGAQRVMLIVGSHLATETDEIDRIRAALGPRAVLTHQGIRPHVMKSDVIAAALRAADERVDLVVAVGGGSVIDAAKMVVLSLRHGARTVEDLAPLRMGQPPAPEGQGPVVRLVLVPATLSAGEFNPMAGATDEARGQKEGYADRVMSPTAVVLDPAITRHTPEWLWLSTGVRAVDHAVETLVSRRSNDHADGLAESGLSLLAQGLRQVKEYPDDMEARLRCQVGAWHAMLPLVGGVPMGASHAIGHALGGHCKVPHGYTSCVMAPEVQRWNAEVDTHGHARAAACFDAGGRPLGDVLDDFIRGLGLPRRLAEVGVTRQQLHEVAEHALHDIWAKTNPRPIDGIEDMLAILGRAGAAD